MRIFISSQAIDRPPASLLVARCRALGWAVTHSPSNPRDRDDDPRWAGWYGNGLPAALADAQAFVAVIDEAWESSSWMATEADAARRPGSAWPRCYSWAASDVQVSAAGMLSYLGVRLPRSLDEAVAVLEADGAACGEGRSP